LKSDLSLESFVEDGGKQGVELGRGLGLKTFQRVHLSLKAVQLGNDTALLG
jgi:hypothetical protein